MARVSAGATGRHWPLSGMGPRSGAFATLTRRTLRDARTRTVAFAYLFALYSYLQPVGFRHAYPTAAARLGFARSFANNDALRLFYGYPYDPLTIGGYSAWRVGGTLAIAAAIFGVLAAVRALRTEEDAGRTELVLGAAVARRTVYGSASAAISVGLAALWLAEFAGFAVAGLPVGQSAYLALATASVACVFAAVGAVVSQLAATRRAALQLGSAAVAVLLLVRVVADTSSGAGALRWATPLGWAEELRPFSGARPLVLALPITVSALLVAVAASIASRRDIGTGVLASRDTAAPRLSLLSSPAAFSLRDERGSLIAWAAGTGAFAFILGIVSTSLSSVGISARLERELSKLGSGSIVTPTGYLGFVFIFFIAAISLFTCAQVVAARRCEADEQLETLLALPVSRDRWLWGG